MWRTTTAIWEQHEPTRTTRRVVIAYEPSHREANIGEWDTNARVCVCIWIYMGYGRKY